VDYAVVVGRCVALFEPGKAAADQDLGRHAAVALFELIDHREELALIASLIGNVHSHGDLSVPVPTASRAL
jgi:hypothetical protein